MQNDQGVPNEEQLLPVFLPDGSGQCNINPDFFNDLLAAPAVSNTPPEHANRQRIQQRMQARANEELARRCTELRHPNDIVLLGIVDIASG